MNLTDEYLQKKKSGIYLFFLLLFKLLKGTYILINILSCV